MFIIIVLGASYLIGWGVAKAGAPVSVKLATIVAVGLVAGYLNVLVNGNQSDLGYVFTVPASVVTK